MNDNTDSDPPVSTPLTQSINRIDQTDRVVIPVIDEQIQVGKRIVETGQVRIRKTVHHEEQVVDLPLVHEEFNVERVAINQYVDTAPAIRYEGETTVFPVLKEVVVIEKKLVLVEEVHITKRQTTTHDPQRIVLRKEEIAVDHLANPPERPA